MEVANAEILALILAQDNKGNDELLDKIIAATKALYINEPPEAWVDLATKIRDSFGLEEADVARLVGLDESGDRDRPPARVLTPRVDIRTLVPTGWFSRYLHYVRESEAPTSFHFGSALSGVAAGLGRKPLIDWQARATYPNLYVLLIGPTGSRKGSAVERGVKVTSLALETNVLPTEGTHQGYAAALKRESEAQGSATGYIVAPEFSVLAGEDRNKGALIQWLTDWYDSPAKWERALRGEGMYSLDYVCVNLLGASNLPWLRKMPPDAITGGYMGRHVIFAEPGKRHWNPNPKFANNEEVELIGELVDAKRRGIPENIGVSKAASDWMNDWYMTTLRAQFDGEKDEKFRAWLDRKQAALLKMAVVWQIADQGPLDAVARQWMELACGIVDWCDASVREVYSALDVGQEGACAADVLDALHRHGGELSQKRLVRLLRNKWDSKSVAGAIATLAAGDELRRSRRTNPLEGVVWVER